MSKADLDAENTVRQYYWGTKYSSHDHERVQNLFEYQITVLAIAGQHPKKLIGMLPGWLGCAASVLAYFHSAWFIINSLLFSALHFKSTWDSIRIGDFERISNAFLMAIIYLVSAISNIFTLLRLDDLLKLLEFVNEYHRHHSLPGLTYVTSFKSARKGWVITKVWILSCVIGVCIWSIAPLLHGQRILPLKCWYPFDVSKPIVFEINYLLQFQAQIIVGITFGITSGCFVSIVLILLGQFDVLYCSIKNVFFHAKLLSDRNILALREIQQELPSRESDELNQYMLLEEHFTDLSVLEGSHIKSHPKRIQYATALKQSLVECVDLHRFILKGCKDVENLYHPYCFVVSMQVMVQLCLIVFNAVTGEYSMLKVFNLLQYFFLTLCNISFFTISGELLQQHSVRINEAFARSNWSLDDIHLIKNDLLIFLMNGNHVATITSAKLFTMDVNFLRRILTQAFSFFTLLRKLAKKKKF